MANFKDSLKSAFIFEKVYTILITKKAILAKSKIVKDLEKSTAKIPFIPFVLNISGMSSLASSSIISPKIERIASQEIEENYFKK